jgi:hypothetical protein
MDGWKLEVSELLEAKLPTFMIHSLEKDDTLLCSIRDKALKVKLLQISDNCVMIEYSRFNHPTGFFKEWDMVITSNGYMASKENLYDIIPQLEKVEVKTTNFLKLTIAQIKKYCIKL